MIVTRELWDAKVGQWYMPEPNTGCWLWMKCLQRDGYGTQSHLGGTRFAHRISWELHRGLIPKDMTIDHLCRVRCCVNPDHMEVVSNRTNVLRGIGLTAQNARKTHCPKGHEYSTDNTIHRRGERHCRECCNAHVRDWKIRKRSAGERF